MSLLVVGGDPEQRRSVAEAFHHESPLRSGPLVVADSGRDEELLVRALRGWLSQTSGDPGAHALRGAERGTLFIDRVTSLSPSSQRMLLAFSRMCSAEPLDGAIAWPGRLATGFQDDPEVAVAAGTFSMGLLDSLDKIRVHIGGLPEQGAA